MSDKTSGIKENIKKDENTAEKGKFRENRPRFRLWAHRFSELVGYLNFLALSLYAFSALLILYAIYNHLDESIRLEIAFFVITILASCFIPYHIQKRKERRDLYARNEKYYLDLASEILESYENGKFNPEICYNNVKKYTKENSKAISLQFSDQSIYIINEILLESSDKGSEILLKKRVKSYFRIVRQHLGLSMVFDFKRFLDSITQKQKENEDRCLMERKYCCKKMLKLLAKANDKSFNNETDI